MSDAAYWNSIIDIANKTRKMLDDKPRDLRVGYGLHPGAILNAYREGDATFSEAVEAIRSIGPYRLSLDERPSLNGMLLDAEIERAAAVGRGDTDRAGIMANRVAVLRRLLAAFPIDK